MSSVMYGPKTGRSPESPPRLVASRSKPDLLGVMVISFIVVLGGGVPWDLLIGATPPNAVADGRYPALASLPRYSTAPVISKN